MTTLQKAPRILLRTFLAVATCAVFPITSSATDYYINDASTAGDIFVSAVGNNANNGTTPSTPKLTLSNLLSTYGAALNPGDNIYIDAGTYNGIDGITIPPGKPGISFIGAGYQATIFDNQGAGASTDFFMYIRASDTYISGMSFTGYENNGTQTPGHSAQAITIGGSSSSPVTNVLIENVSFYNNGQSGGNPALVVLSYAEVTLRGGGSYCNAPGTQYTGGVEAFGDNLTFNIENYILSGNDKTAFDGGGLRIEGGNNAFINVSNTRISNNIANEGGAISQRNGTLTVTDCIIDGNSTSTSGTHYGGAYRIHAGVATFSRCEFTNNTGGSGCRGGAIGARYVSTGGFSGYKEIHVNIDSCIFSGNSPSNYGRDVYAARGFSNPTFVTLTDCQFLTGGNYNLYSGTASSLSTTYFGAVPTKTGSNTPRSASANTLWTPTPAPPNYSGSCGNITILPIELSGFTGICRSQDNLLQWSTLSEHNNAYFVIQRLDKYGVFITLDEINGAGNSIQTNNYHWTDLSPLQGTNYYRLAQVDYDGRTSYFDPIAVSNECALGNDISYTYNSDANSIIIHYTVESPLPLNISMYSTTGQKIMETSLHLEPHQHSQRIILNKKMPSGIYFLQENKPNHYHKPGKILIH